MSIHSTDAALAKRSTCSFSSLGIYTNLTKNSSLILLLTMLKYSFIRSPFASQSRLMCPTTTCKSQCMTANSALAALDKSRPERTASYSALLLVVKNQRQTTHSIVSPSDDCSKTLAPLSYWLDKPSVHIIHAIDFSSSSFLVMNSTIKSTKACALIVVLGQYQTSNSLSSIVHRTNRPVASELFIIFCSSLSIWTTKVCAWKYSLSFRAAVINAKASFSIGGYLSSSPRSVQLVQYTGNCTQSSSRIRVELTAVRDTAKQRESSSPGLNKLSNGGDARYAFSSSNAPWHSLVHSKAYLSTLKNGRHLFVALEIKRLRDATLLFRLCTSLMFFGGAISIIACTLLGLASTLHCDTVKPKNFLDATPKTHLLGLSIISQRQRVSNVSRRSSKWLTSRALFTSMSSTYTSMFHPIYWANILFTSLWYVALVFFNPNGMTLQQKSPCLVINKVFSQSASSNLI